MQHNRPRGGNPFQERDSHGRFTSHHNGDRDYNSYGGFDGRDDYRHRGDFNYYDDDRRYGYNNRPDGPYEDRNYGGSYRESYGGRGNYQEDNYSNERGGWDSDRSGYEREGYGRNRNYANAEDGYRPDTDNYHRGNYQSDYGRDDYNDYNWNHGRREHGWDNGYSQDNGSSRRGFASMPRSEVRRIAAMGGRASHGRSHHRVSQRRRPR